MGRDGLRGWRWRIGILIFRLKDALGIHRFLKRKISIHSSILLAGTDELKVVHVDMPPTAGGVVDHPNLGRFPDEF